MLTRRSLLAGLAATACAPHQGGLASPPPLPVALGWRLVPGQTLSLLARTERRTMDSHDVRSERWMWRVLAVEHGMATLEAFVVGVGAGVEDAEGELVPTAALPSAVSTLALDRTGTLHAVTDPNLAASLPQYALAVELPERPVGLHDEWPDPIGRLAAGLLPPGLHPDGAAYTALRAVSLVEDRAVATLETRGEVRSEGPRLEIGGTADWDLVAGRLIRRTLEIRASRLGPSPGEHPGVLSITLEP